VDLTTDPGLVMLAKQANGRYHSSGYIVLVFSAGEIVNFKRWDRIRWSADSEDPVKTTVQFGYDGANWSQEFDGGFPEEVGIGGLSNTETLYVRVNLYTNDTESEDPEGNPVGVTPIVFAVEVIARTKGDLIAGNIPDVAGVTSQRYRCQPFQRAQSAVRCLRTDRLGVQRLERNIKSY